jgi:hypothetical protein
LEIGQKWLKKIAENMPNWMGKLERTSEKKKMEQVTKNEGKKKPPIAKIVFNIVFKNKTRNIFTKIDKNHFSQFFFPHKKKKKKKKNAKKG